MRQFAVINERGAVAEIIPDFVMLDGEPIGINKRYTEEFIAGLVECPAGVQQGDVYAQGAFSKPTAPAMTDAEARALRAAKLTACDWTQLLDVPEATRAAWAEYRQALRDVTTQAGYPQAVEWPAEPGV